MISANELRIGNWVAIEKNLGWGMRIYKENHQIVRGLDIDSSEHYLPIPLTPEILEKAGFKNNGEKFFKHKSAVFQIDLDDAGVYVAVVSVYGIGVLENVHQLQNLYFAIMKEELNIEL